MSENTPRAWLAALLAFLYPGLGHLYLRVWLRALAWFLLAVLTAALVIPDSVVAAFESGGVSAMFDAYQQVDAATVAPLMVVLVLNIVDAYITGRRERSRTAADDEKPAESVAGTCPNCGKELDEDLDFCPWCTTRLGSDEDVDEDGESATSR